MNIYFVYIHLHTHTYICIQIKTSGLIIKPSNLREFQTHKKDLMVYSKNTTKGLSPYFPKFATQE